MKKKVLRVVALTIAAALMLTLVAACRNESGEDGGMPDYVFVPEFISMPAGISFISNMVYTGENVFFMTPSWDEETFEHTNRLYMLDLNTNELSELVNYSPPSIPSNAPQDAQMSTHAIIGADADGNLWVFESGSMFHFNIPDDFDGEDYETWQFHESLGSVNILRMLDSTGAEVTSLNLETLAIGGVNSFEFDSDGNMYIIAHGDTPEFGSFQSAIVVLDPNKNPLFTITLDGWGERLLRLSDGSVAYFGFVQDGDFSGRHELQPINLSTRGFDESIPLPDNAWRLFPGNEQFDVLFMDNTTLFGIDFSAEEPEAELILNLVDSDIMSPGSNDVAMLSDGRILTSAEQRGAQGDLAFEIVLLSRTPSSDIPEREIITLATMWMSPELQSAVVGFNRTSTTHRISVTDYAQFNTEEDWTAGLTRLTTEIISGRVPDILDVQQLPIRQYASRGLLVDLNELIASDPELSRDLFVEGVFEAAEMDGRLYQVFPSFTIRTLAGHPSVLGPEPGWNMAEFRAVLQANPNADRPMGSWLTRNSFLQSVIIFNMDQYVDWVAGEAFFDTGEFAELLEFAALFPAENDMTEDMMFMESESELIAQGRQIVLEMSISDLRWMNFQFAQFGGELVFKGFPTEHRNGHSIMPTSGLSITTSASDVAGAWSFVRTFLTEEFQNGVWGLPTHRAAFDRNAQEALEAEGGGGTISWGLGRMETFELTDITQAQIDQVVELIRLAPGIFGWDEVLNNIITEGADDFFSGRGSAQDAARIIQSRVTTYIHEQG